MNLIIDPHLYSLLVTNTDAKTFQWREEIIFRKWYCETLECQPLPIPSTKIYLKWIVNLEIKADIMLLGENRRISLGESKSFLDYRKH